MEESEQVCLFPSPRTKPCSGGMRLLVRDGAEPAAALTAAHGLREMLPKFCSRCEFPVSVDMSDQTDTEVNETREIKVILDKKRLLFIS